MEIEYDFSGLYKAISPIAGDIEPLNIRLNETPRKPYVPVQISQVQKDGITIDDVEKVDGVLSYEGKQILLYIPDHTYQNQYYETLQDPKKGKKFHVAWCSVLQKMYERNAFAKYSATNDLTGEFEIIGKPVAGKAPRTKSPLLVCQKCMEFLNYKGARRPGKARSVAENFSIPEFFECYSSIFKFMPSGFKVDSFAYTKDWPEISEQKRFEENYTCQECEINLSDNRYLLHVHHVNGVKGDNSSSNLRVLCADCHRKQPAHEHIFVSHEDMQIITSLRKKRPSGIPADWKNAIGYADSSIKGALDVLRMQGWEAPVVGFEIMNSHGEIIEEVEAGWPQRKFAIVLRNEDKISIDGWTVKTFAEVLQEFD